MPLMTSKDESCEEVPALTPFLAAPKQQTRVAAWNVIENLHVLSPFCLIKKHSFNFLCVLDLENFLEKVQQNGPAGRKEDRKTTRTRQRNKTGDSKVESNDSPEIPDRGRHQTSPASLQGPTQEWSVKLSIKSIGNSPLSSPELNSLPKVKVMQP